MVDQSTAAGVGQSLATAVATAVGHSLDVGIGVGSSIIGAVGTALAQTSAAGIGDSLVGAIGTTWDYVTTAGVGLALAWAFAGAAGIGAALDTDNAAANGIGAAPAISAPGGIPIISGGPFVMTDVVTVDDAVGILSVTNLPLTAMNIVSGDTLGNFAVYFSNQALRTSPNGPIPLHGSTYTLGITATNASGTGPTFSVGVSIASNALASGTASATAPVIISATGVGLAAGTAVARGFNSSTDGAAGAPAGTAQFPNLFTSASGIPPGMGGAIINNTNAPYITRPPWNVPGVDYHVGIDRSLYPTNANLKDPAPGGILVVDLVNKGGTLNGTLLTFSGPGANNATVDGYDFTKENLCINVGNGATNFTLQNCNWVNVADVRSFIVFDNTCNTCTVQKCELDAQNRGVTGTGMFEVNAVGTTTIQYNLIQNPQAEMIVYGQSPNGACTHLTQFNVFRDAHGDRLGAHGDWVQEVQSGSGQITISTTYNNNLVIQALQPGIDGTGVNVSCQGWSIFSANQPLPGVCNAVNITNNTYICIVGNQPNFIQLVNNTGVNGVITITNNYADMTAVNSGWLFYGPDTSRGSYNGTLSSSGNINLKTGGIVAGS